jgi:hypothetical protein
VAHQTALLTRERLTHLAKRIHALGARPLFELLLELQDGAPLADALDRYARIAPLSDFLAAHGGRELEPARLVTRRRA